MGFGSGAVTISLLCMVLRAALPSTVLSTPTEAGNQEGEFNIFVSTFGGDTITVSGVSPFRSVNDLRDTLSETLPFRSLHFENTELGDYVPLSQYHIKPRSILHLNLAPFDPESAFSIGVLDESGVYKQFHVNPKMSLLRVYEGYLMWKGWKQKDTHFSYFGRVLKWPRASYTIKMSGLVEGSIIHVRRINSTNWQTRRIKDASKGLSFSKASFIIYPCFL
jgi:hypothetical protein